MSAEKDEFYMSLALEEARLAKQEGEIPVGAVLVSDDGTLICKTHNATEAEKSPLAHAEMIALHKACQSQKSWRLNGCTLYVTLEPCPMCMGALIHARIARIVYGAPDPRAGACGSLLNLADYPLESEPAVTKNVLRSQCQNLLRSFFILRRNQRL